MSKSIYRNSIFAIAFAFVLATSVRADVFTSPDGHKFEAVLKPHKKVVLLGEPTYFDLEIRNLSDVELGVLIGGDYRNEYGRPESFDIRVMDPSGRVLEKKELMTMGGMIGEQRAPIAGMYSFRFYLPHWATISEAGAYRIVLKKDLVVAKYSEDWSAKALERKGTPVDLHAEISVRAGTRKEMGQVVANLGERLIAADHTAEKLVPFINDERIIPWLAKAIEKNATLMRHLAKFSQNAALNAVISRIADPDAEVRRNVSVALAKSVHPRSKKYLIGMRTDESFAIRNDVVQYLGQTKTAESTRILLEMALDKGPPPHPSMTITIADEAKRYLKERGELPN